jgi:DNA (cytosine-5)-methyltransferase 1
LAVDTNDAANTVFDANFRPERLYDGAIEDLADGELGTALTRRERRLRSDLGSITLAVGGPPCQGHSDLNNHTRRGDPRNALYLRMARFIEVVRPEHAIIENVPGVVHDWSGVVDLTRQLLTGIGYTVTDGVLAADQLGWAQRRRRHVLLASRKHDEIDIADVRVRYVRSPLPVSWTLTGAPRSESVLDTSAKHSATNLRRIRYLFDHGLFELPDEQRPDCHRLKPHSYRSVYGRMRPDEPAPTITSGFGSTGQGRFVHPLEPRTLTPREAARIQGFPDWFDFGSASSRRALQEMIGNAVPSRLAYVAALELLR